VTRRTRIALLALVASLGIVPAGLALVPGLTEEPDLNGPRNESQPAIGRARGVDVLVWSLSRPGRRDQSDVYLRKGANAKLKLNTKGLGYSGDIDAPWVVYQQAVGGASDIKLYRLDKRKRVALPPGLNTKQWEWRPRISGNWILFVRESSDASVKRIVLFNRRTRAQRVLDTVRRASYSLVSAQINGNWATWYKCTPVCDGFLYNIAARAKTKLPKPAGPGHVNVWAPAVTKTGVVYAGQGPDDCGDAAQMVRYRRSGDPATGTVLLTLPAGTDFNGLYARTNGDGSVDIFYARVTCGSPETTDVYHVTDPAPPPR
jgi:hypothetical protein